MNVGELREELDNYGDHLPVSIVFSRGERETIYQEFEVADTNRLGEPTVVLEVEA